MVRRCVSCAGVAKRTKERNLSLGQVSFLWLGATYSLTTLKMDAAGFFEALVAIYQSPQRHIAEDSSLH